MSELSHRIRRYADAHANSEGAAALPLPGAGAMRAYAPTGMTKSIYKPLVCLVLQGAKQVTVGSDTHGFGPGQCAVISAHVPVSSRVTCASRSEPYLALAIELDMAVLLDVASQLDGSPSRGAATVRVDDTEAAVADCALRLMRLLDRPDSIPVLHASILRELHYWLLQSPDHVAIRTLARPDAMAHRVARAVSQLRAEFDRKLRVEQLAATAGMSASSFHHHFRLLTTLSPIQFQKQLRLIEARRRILEGRLPANRAAFAVGYESVSQFTREYVRMFGLPPGRDKGGHRAASSSAELSA